MKNIIISASLFFIGAFIFSACKKDSTYTSSLHPEHGKIPPSDTSVHLKGAYNGVLTGGKVYTIDSDIVVNSGDTLWIQAGVTININGNRDVIVRGALICLGTKDSNNYFTVLGVQKNDAPPEVTTTDPAFAAKWQGINCDTSCGLLILKWTHLEFGGGNIVIPPSYNYSTGKSSYVISFLNTYGMFDLEDSWIYGAIDDAIRVTSGSFNIMRNTFEKCGLGGGEGINVKSGGVGDVAFNLFIGCATNGSKASNKGGTAVQCNMNMYNNTYINCGYRRTSTGRGGCIDYEEGAMGKAYNNLVVNCKYGFRVIQNIVADTANLFYGNTYCYVDDTTLADQIYPTTYITKPQPTDIPAPSSFLPANYILGDNFDGSHLVHANDPMFVNYPLPTTQLYTDIDFAKGFDFHLKSGSPAIGKGDISSLSPIAPIILTGDLLKKVGGIKVNYPSVDIGCYPIDGTGNQH